MKIQKHSTTRLKNGQLLAVEDDLAVEAGLEIVVDNMPYAITMRLPGDDIHLVAGFCLTEGIIDSEEDLLSISHCDRPGGENKVLVQLKPNGAGRPNEAAKKDAPARKRPRGFVSKSSCGVCGKTGFEEIYTDVEPSEGSTRFSIPEMQALRVEFESRKAVFPVTGSTHSAALFDGEKRLLTFAEDIGRHNALDKAIGAVLLEGLAREAVLAVVSSRLSYEMVQKAGVLGLEILAGVSAATTMAVEFAEKQNITLIGFLRENRMNVYTNPERILST